VTLGAFSGGDPARHRTPTRPRQIGAVRNDQVVNFSIVLRLPGASRLKAFLAAANDPRSPSFHHFITARTFGARYGVSRAELSRLRHTLALAGVSVIGVYAERTTATARATSGALSRLFRVRLGNFLDAAGHHYQAPLAPPIIPASLRASIAGLRLADQRIIHPAAIRGDGLTPHDTALAYDIAPLHQRGLLGQGQRIAVVSFDAFQDSDVASFDRLFGISGPTVRHVQVGAGTAPGPGQDEVDLDIDVIRSIAPRAQIFNYEGSNDGTQSFGDIVHQIVTDGQAKIISISWGQCETSPQSTAVIQQDNNEFAAALAAGITTFVASGDNGAYTCEREDPSNHALTVSWPASSPNVIAVGGTVLATRQDGTYLDEAGWENALSRGGGGGGLSAVEPRPSWQAGIPLLTNASHRAIPDVAGPADPSSGFVVYSRGQRSGANGGTSAATPFWAGSMLLVSELAQQTGAGPLGQLAPILYEIASTRQRYPPFHDVTRGGNRYYQATTGWDFATGLGSPDVYNLARDVVTYLKAHGPHR
jgi:kumamolisin